MATCSNVCGGKSALTAKIFSRMVFRSLKSFQRSPISVRVAETNDVGWNLFEKNGVQTDMKYFDRLVPGLKCVKVVAISKTRYGVVYLSVTYEYLVC